jgi:hypothetical protein
MFRVYALILLIILFIILVFNKYNHENFNFSYRETSGKVFGEFINPQHCTPQNNCFKGAYLRSQTYQNVCPPKYGKLNREKIQLQDDCDRTLGNYPKQKYSFNCYVDNHLNRHCSWKENN